MRCGIVFIEWKMIMMFKKINFKKVSDPANRKFTSSEMFLLVVMSLVIGLLFGGLFTQTNTITKKVVVTDEKLKEVFSLAIHLQQSACCILL